MYHHVFFYGAAGHGLLFLELRRSFTALNQSLGLLWRRDQPEAETSTS
jgi:hypothetical protein